MRLFITFLGAISFMFLVEAIALAAFLAWDPPGFDRMLVCIFFVNAGFIFSGSAKLYAAQKDEAADPKKERWS